MRLLCTSVRVCLRSRLRGSQVALSSEVLGERWGPRRAVGKEDKLLLSHTSMQRQQMCQTALRSHLRA